MDFWTQINWKTTGYGLGYLACQIIGNLYEPARTLCDVVDKLIIAAGLISAADSTRVQSIVNAVDGLLGYKKPILPVQADLAPAVKP